MIPLNHIDIRVNDLSAAYPFYEKLLSAMGYTRQYNSRDWRVFCSEGDFSSAVYIALTEDADHKPNGNTIGFGAGTREEVDAAAKLVLEAGGAINSGPQLFPISPTYYACYFEDICGNKFEVLHRTS